MLSYIALFALVAVASADNPRPYQPQPAPYQPAPYAPRPAYKQPAYEEPANYEYNYAVLDQYAGVDFDANEARDGYSTNGGYRVALPDGRVQTVTYNVADGYSGYVADVQYEGEARYEEPKYQQPRAYPAPRPSYPAPRPAYPAHQPSYQ